MASELVELEAFLRELRGFLVNNNSSVSQAIEVQAFLLARSALVAQSHALIRGMLYGL